VTAAGTKTSLRLAMRLPRVAGSVTTARHRLERALGGIGVRDECRDDIALALTEAGSNAVEHAQIGHEYVVVVTVDRTRCVVEVVDTGVEQLSRPVDGFLTTPLR
jgi:serine/threonine-protein kinase RsbW